MCVVLCYSSSKPSSSDHITTRMVVLFSVSREYDESTFEAGELRSNFLRIVYHTLYSSSLQSYPSFCLLSLFFVNVLASLPITVSSYHG